MTAKNSLIHTIKNKPLNTNTYIYNKKEATYVIDPGFNFLELNKVLRKLEARNITVLITHGHFDHIGGASLAQQKYMCPVVINEADIPIAKMSNFLTKALTLKVPKFELPNFIFYGEAKLPHYISIQKFPGHTPGSVLINIEDKCFSGDSLYEEDIQQNNLPGYDKKLHQISINWAKKNIGTNIEIWPGHGHPTRINRIYSYD